MAAFGVATFKGDRKAVLEAPIAAIHWDGVRAPAFSIGREPYTVVIKPFPNLT
jgi:hypothetical protein